MPLPFQPVGHDLKLGPPQVGQHDARALLGQSQGRLRPDRTRRAGDQRYLPIQ